MSGSNGQRPSARALLERSSSKEGDRVSLREERKQLVAGALGAAKENSAKSVELAERRTLAMENSARSTVSMVDRMMMLMMMRMFGPAAFQALGDMPPLFPPDIAPAVMGAPAVGAPALVPVPAPAPAPAPGPALPGV